MKTIRIILVLALTAAALLLIISPVYLQQIMPAGILNAAKLEEFPLLGSCSKLAMQLLSALNGQSLPEISAIGVSLGPSWTDELSALLMVSVLSIPVSLVLGLFLYRPLYSGILQRALLYISHNLVSVMLAWMLYRHFYFSPLIEGVLMKHINDQTFFTIANLLTQLFSAAAIGVIALKIAFAFIAARIVMHKVIMPLIGTVIRTLLFAFLIALLLLLPVHPAGYLLHAGAMLLTLVLCSINDWIFGC